MPSTVRKQSEEIYSLETQAGNTMGNALSNTNGEYNVKEAYIETRVPLLTDAPFARSWEFEAAYRIGDYSTVGTVDSWKAGTTWAPIDDIRFRAVYSVATRAPSIGELFCRSQPDVRDRAGSVRRRPSTEAGPVGDFCRSIPGIAQQIATTGGFDYTLGDEQSMEGLQPQQPGRGRGAGEDLDRRRRADAAGLPQLHDVDRLFPDRDRRCDPAGVAQTSFSTPA